MSHQLAFCLVSEKLQVWKFSLISAGARCCPRLCPSNSWWSCIAMLVLNHLFLLNLTPFLFLSLPFLPQPLLEEKKPVLTSNLCVAVFGVAHELLLPHPAAGQVGHGREGPRCFSAAGMLKMCLLPASCAVWCDVFQCSWVVWASHQCLEWCVANTLHFLCLLYICCDICSVTCMIIGKIKYQTKMPEWLHVLT